MQMVPNYMKARDNQSNTMKDLNQLMTELEPNVNFLEWHQSAEVDWYNK